MKPILLIGGAGYIGTVLTEHLLSNKHKVRCIDNLAYEQHGVLKLFLKNKNYEFHNSDIRDKNLIKEHFNGIETVVLLAGIVGDPISKKYPSITTEVNLKGTYNVINICEEKKIKRLIYISTCSNYGITDTNKIADENHKLKPLSLYAKTKVEIENFLINLDKKKELKPTILRFATAFGLSPRMRFDLTVSEFTKQLALGKELEVYDPNTWRPYCHTRDFANFIHQVITAKVDDVAFEIFNVGDNRNNFTKKMIVDQILEFFPDAKIKYLSKGFDARDYRVNFSKVKSKFGFTASYSLKEGIKELIKEIEKKKFKFENQYQYGNYKLIL